MPLKLVGYARAAGDGALVATLHDVAVLPELRRRGLGRALLRRLLAQVLPTSGSLWYHMRSRSFQGPRIMTTRSSSVL